MELVKSGSERLMAVLDGPIANPSVRFRSFEWLIPRSLGRIRGLKLRIEAETVRLSSLKWLIEASVVRY